MPSQMSQPDSTQYAHPAYWDGNLTACSWYSGNCDPSLPFSGSCIFLSVRSRRAYLAPRCDNVSRAAAQCTALDFACPPPEVPLCPQDPKDRLSHACGLIPNRTDGKRYYQHACGNPALLPHRHMTTLLMCKESALPNGDFDCFFYQTDEDGELSSAPLTLECSTGSCLYGPPVHIDVPRVHSVRWTVSCPASRVHCGAHARPTRRVCG